MPIKYEQLKKNERCIYQAFSKASGVNDLPEVMGAHVNKMGIDADDERAVIELAKKYGFTGVEGVKASDLAYPNYTPPDDTFHQFDANAEVIAVITRSTTAIGLFDKYVKRFDPGGLMTDPACKNVHWHAIYGKSDNHNHVVWLDDQQIFPNGPVGNAVAVCFIKR